MIHNDAFPFLSPRHTVRERILIQNMIRTLVARSVARFTRAFVRQAPVPAGVPLHFATFADKRYSVALGRIGREARKMSVFQSISCWNEDNLDPQWWRKHRDFITQSKKGFGYYIWKPQVLVQTLDQIPTGSILLYLDSGCCLCPEGRVRLGDYCRMVSEHESGLLGFKMPYSQRHWTKGYTMAAFQFNEAERQAPQHAACVLFIQKRPSTVAFARRWRDACEDHSAIDDCEYGVPNTPGFQQHRHDQSLFTLFFQRAGGLAIPDET